MITLTSNVDMNVACSNLEIAIIRWTLTNGNKNPLVEQKKAAEDKWKRKGGKHVRRNH